MPPQCRAKPLSEKAETVVEPRSELLHPKRRGACCRQLNGKRYAVEPSADRRHSRCGLRVRGKMRVGSLGPRDEQRDRAVSKYLLHLLRVLRRHRQRWHPVEVLALCSELLTACRNHTCCRVSVQQCFDHLCRGVDYMLAIIEHEHHVL